MKFLKLLVLGLLLVNSTFAATWERPAGSYTPSNHSVNITKYQTDSANHVAISSAKVDGDINKAYQGLNDIEARTAPSVSGKSGQFLTNNGTAALWSAITASTFNSVSATSGQVLTADGAGSTSWTTVVGVPTGAVMPFAGTSSTVPSGWLLAYGQAISRSTYSALYAVVGTTYGVGDGSTTFNLPDLRGRVPAGLDNMGGTAASRVSLTTSGISGTVLGAAGGDQNMQAHNHSVTDPGHAHTFSSGASAGAGSRGDAQGASVVNNTFSATTGITIDVSGTGTSQNMQPTMMLNMIIKF